MENNKKILVPTIIAVVTLILLAFGATYAYFTVGSTNNFGTKDLNANIQDMADAVVLEQVENELSLNVTRAMMSQDNAGTTYYASGSSTPAKIAKMSVAGDGRYVCDYKIKITKTASSPENDLYTAFQAMRDTTSWDQVYLEINGGLYDGLFGYHDGVYDFWDLSFPITYSGTADNITEDTPKYITANLAIANINENQDYLKGKDITLTFEVTEFDCYLHEANDNAPIYAIYEKNDDLGNVVVFFQNYDEVNVGDTYYGHNVDAIYTNLNNTNYSSKEDVPWYSESYMVLIAEPIRPTNIAYWFSNSHNSDLHHLDTSKVTSMSHAFDGIGGTEWSDYDLYFDTSNVIDMSYAFANMDGEVGFIVDLSTWDTSKVTNMEGMFEGAMYVPDISRWNTSNVTNMSYMFQHTFSIDVDLSTWDTSNVEDMAYMFYGTATDDYFYIGDVSKWDTSKVTNMESMFENAGLYYDYSLNLTNWKVPLVTNHETFNDGVEDKIIPPTWVN